MTQRILIIGAGFGGMWSALSAMRLLDRHQRLDIGVTLLAPQAELRVRPRFYEADLTTTVAPLGPLFDAVGVQLSLIHILAFFSTSAMMRSWKLS